MKNIAFGIDFGTTNSLLSVGGEIVGKSKPVPIWDTNRRPHPSVVQYQLDAAPRVGSGAKRDMTEMQNSLGNRFYRSIKRELGKGGEFEIPGMSPAPASRIAGEIFKHLKSTFSNSPTNSSINEELTEAVVSIPIHFNGRARSDLRNAMAEAGIRPTTFVHEPLAAAISHFYDHDQKLAALRGKRVLVFDWGGGTLDICVIGVSEDGRDLVELGTAAMDDLAGDEFDSAIMAALQSRFLDKNKLSSDAFTMNPSTEGRFRNRCELAKIELSRDQETGVTVPNFHESAASPDLIERFKRSDFEQWVGGRLDQAMATVDQCLKDASTQPELISHVLMVGGSSKIPAIQRRMEDLFGSRVEVADEPDAAISRGAAIVAAEGWLPFAARRISVKLSDDSFFPILESGTTLTSSVSQSLSFFCIDPRSGNANFWFYDHPDQGHGQPKKLDSFLSIPISPQISALEDLKRDRLICDFALTENLTLQCNGRSSSLGQDRDVEVFDIHFGLRIG